jgi:branched-chain amino acid transport system permease protein
MLSDPELFILALLATLAPYILVTLSLNLEYGFGGVPNFGKTLAVAGGAFVAGYLPGRLLASLYGVGKGLDYILDNTQIIPQVNAILSKNIAMSIGIFLLTMGAVILFGALLGLVVAYPVARLRSDYLGMTFLAAGQVMLVIGNTYMPLVGGPFGVRIPDPFAWVASYPIAGLTGGQTENIFVVAVMMLIALIAFIYVQKLTSSPLGRLLRAIRDDENSALALGKDVQRKRIMVIIFASALAAIAGAMYGFYTTDVLSASFSRTDWTFWPWIMVILGGAANNAGVVVGTFIFVVIRQAITYYQNLFTFLPFNVVWLDTLILGSVLIIVLLYRPDGILKEKPIKTIKSADLLAAKPKSLSTASENADNAGQPGQSESGKPKRSFWDLFREKKGDEDKK